MDFEDLKAFVRGIEKIDYNTFHAVLVDVDPSIDDHYIRECYRRFRQHPHGYIITRRPEEQGRKLLEKVMEIGHEFTDEDFAIV